MRSLVNIYLHELTTLNSPADIQVLREAFKLARRIGETAPMSDILLAELSPGKAVSSDGQCLRKLDQNLV